MDNNFSKKLNRIYIISVLKPCDCSIGLALTLILIYEAQGQWKDSSKGLWQLELAGYVLQSSVLILALMYFHSFTEKCLAIKCNTTLFGHQTFYRLDTSFNPTGSRLTVYDKIWMISNIWTNIAKHFLHSNKFDMFGHSVQHLHVWSPKCSIMFCHQTFPIWTWF